MLVEFKIGSNLVNYNLIQKAHLQQGKKLAGSSWSSALTLSNCNASGQTQMLAGFV